jgi:ABC-type uncharacterized transport system substrate-binding protein
MVATVLLRAGRRILPRLTVLLSLGFVLVAPIPSHAAGKLVAAVLTCDLPRYREAHRSFVKTLAQKGYDQSNLEIIVQSPNPDPISWANSIRKFKGIGADIIVTYGAPATLAAMREADDTPIVFVDVYGPVEIGVSRSMSMTGSYLAGVSSKGSMLNLIRTAREVRPFKSLGVVYSNREAGSVVQLKEIKRVAAQLGFAVIEGNASSAATLDRTIESLLSQVDFLYVSEGSVGAGGIDKIIQRALTAQIPVISQLPEAAEKGALISFGANAAEQGQLAAECALKILGGRKPGQLAISTPRKFDFILNLRSARALDLNIPAQMVGAATKVIR